MDFIPREQRVHVWSERAYEHARTNGARSIAAGIAAINAGFGVSSRINDHKLTVERAMRRGVDHKNICDFGNVAFLCPPTLAGALVEVERNYRAEVRDRQRRERSGFPTRNPNHERRLNQARLFLRWYRRFGDQQRFAAIWDALTTSPVYAVAAE